MFGGVSSLHYATLEFVVLPVLMVCSLQIVYISFGKIYMLSVVVPTYHLQVSESFPKFRIFYSGDPDMSAHLRVDICDVQKQESDREVQPLCCSSSRGCHIKVAVHSLLPLRGDD